MCSRAHVGVERVERCMHARRHVGKAGTKTRTRTFRSERGDSSVVPPG